MSIQHICCILRMKRSYDDSHETIFISTIILSQVISTFKLFFQVNTRVLAFRDEMFKRNMACHYPLYKWESIFWLNRVSRLFYLTDARRIGLFMSCELATYHRLQFTFSINGWRCNGVARTTMPILIPILGINLPERLQPRNHKIL